MPTNRRERRAYTEDFKRQIVSLYQHGKTKTELIQFFTASNLFL